MLDAIPARAAIRDRLGALLSAGVVGAPRIAAGRIFHVRRRGTDRQGILYVREGVDAADRVLIDPGSMDPDGLIALDWWYPSLDGRLVAYGLSHGGDELSTLHVRDVALGTDLSDRIPYTQRASVAWTARGFFYTVHPRPGTVPPGDEHYHRRVRYHAVGDDPARDPLVFGEGRAKEDILQVHGSPDGPWVLVTAAHGWTRNDAYLLDASIAGDAITIHEGVDAVSDGFVRGDRVWLRTNLDAPNFRIVAVDPRDPSPERWKTVIAESDDPIESFALTRDRIVVHTLRSAASRLAVWTMTGGFERELPIDGPGTVEGPHADAEGDAVGYMYTSFILPGAAVLADVRDGRAREVARLDAPGGGPSAAPEVHQVTYASRDGTPVTMFVVRRSEAPTRDLPTVLSGYGGFSVARTPAYNAGVAWWVEQGGLYALANLRGGSERGDAWHRAGMLGNKQRVFDDFIGAAEALVAGGWTSPSRLGIEGGSNGGLLVGAALAQRPDLFAAVVCRVPLLDMLRYQNFRIARFWIPEYGSSEDPAAFAWLRAYSPYHNVDPARRYPALLLTTAEGDSRVDPMHAKKMAAQLQSFQDDPPVLLRVDRDAGHGVGKPLDLLREDLADLWSFMAWRLGGEDGMLGLR